MQLEKLKIIDPWTIQERVKLKLKKAGYSSDYNAAKLIVYDDEIGHININFKILYDIADKPFNSFILEYNRQKNIPERLLLAIKNIYKEEKYRCHPILKI
jgi:hypothetical protein